MTLQQTIELWMIFNQELSCENCLMMVTCILTNIHSDVKIIYSFGSIKSNCNIYRNLFLIAPIHLFLLKGLLSDPSAIQEFSKEYIVEEDLVRKYVCHLEDLQVKKKKETGRIKEKASKRRKQQDVR